MNDQPDIEMIESPEEPAPETAPEPPSGRPWLRWLIQLAIAGFWIAMMALLVRDYMLPSRFDQPLDAVKAAELKDSWTDYEEWMTLNFQTLPIQGASYVAVKRMPDGEDYAFTARYVMFLPNLQEATQMKFEIAARLDDSFSLNQFDINVNLPSRKVEIRGLLEKNALYYGVRSDNADEKIGIMPIKGNLTFMEGMQSMMPRNMELEVGKEFKFRAFDPVWNFNDGEMVMKVVEREPIEIDDTTYDTFRVDFQFKNFTTSTWVTPEGDTVKRQIANILQMTKADPEQVRQFPGFGEPLVPPEYTTDDFVLYMDHDDTSAGRATGLLGLIGLIAGQEDKK